MSQYLSKAHQLLQVIMLTIVVSACGPTKYKVENSVHLSSIDDGSGGIVQVNSVEPQLGIAQFNAINENFLQLTTINRNSCNGEYRSVMNSLPSTTDIATVTASVQTASMRLAACYCKELAIDNDNGSWDRVIASISRDKRGGDLTDGEILTLAQTLRARFLGSNLAHLNEGAVDAEVQRILKESLRLDSSLNSSGATRRAAFSGCTLLLSSLNSNLL